MGKAGRPNGSNNYKAQQFIDAIPNSGGIITTIADRVGCTWHTAKKHIDSQPTVAQAYANECEKITDMAETVLFKSIKAEDAWAVKYYLSTKGKHRGYVERQELAGVKNEPLVVEYVNDWRNAEDTTS